MATRTNIAPADTTEVENLIRALCAAETNRASCCILLNAMSDEVDRLNRDLIAATARMAR
jgi:hypothetical protein